MSLLARNMEIIRKQSRAMAEAIAAPKTSAGSIEENSEYGVLELQIDGRRLFLHSLYNKQREFKEMFRDVPDRVTRLIVFGLGDGSVLDYIQQHYLRLEHLIIVEPHAAVLERILAKNKFETVFSAFKKVSFFINCPLERLTKELDTLLLSAAELECYNSVVGLFAYQNEYKEYHRALLNSALQALRLTRVNMHTVDYFRLLWLVNFWRNLKQFELGVSSIEPVFKGRPAIIVSAGPSLAKNIDQLEAIKNKALIIAVGSAMTILESHGITPHFRVAVDGSEESGKIFKAVDTRSCPLIYGAGVYHEIVSEYKGPKVHMPLTLQHLGNYVNEKAKLEGPITRSGFSVANVAMDLVCQLGCATIILIGQDLCYTDGRMHAQGAWDEENDSDSVMTELETVNVFGEKVYTAPYFVGMKTLFEMAAAGYGGVVKLINATEGGLKIEGMLHKPLAQVIEEELKDSYDFDNEIEKLVKFEKEHLAETTAKLADGIAVVDAALDLLIEWTEKNYRDIGKTLALLLDNGGGKQIIKGMDKITKTFALINGLELYQRAIAPLFVDKFKLRQFAAESSSAQWRDVAEQDLKAFLANTVELAEYLGLMKDLIREYRGEKTLDIVFS